jgi:hypothetical protein
MVDRSRRWREGGILLVSKRMGGEQHHRVHAIHLALLGDFFQSAYPPFLVTMESTGLKHCAMLPPHAKHIIE